MSVAAPAKSPGGYEVGRPHGKCLVTGNPIEPGQKFMAALRETDLGFERVDLSLDAWQSFDRADVLAFWQATMPHPEQKKKLLVDDAILCELFERLASATEANKIDFRFVLGLILMRKRLLAYESTRTVDGKEYWVIKPKGRDDRLEMLNPRLDEARVTEVSAQMSEILNQEL